MCYEVASRDEEQEVHYSRNRLLALLMNIFLKTKKMQDCIALGAVKRGEGGREWEGVARKQD